MGNTGPPRTRTRPWCSHCGAGLVVPPAGAGAGSSSVRCALCHRVTRIERQYRSVGGNSMLSAPSVDRRELPAAGAAAGYPVARGNKRAVLVGVSYTGTDYELKGTVNDVNSMRGLLCDKFGFPSDCILILTEKSDDPRRVPTKENLLAAMRWLVAGCEAGHSLVFHFSGHGVQKLDTDGDEVDGYNEALCPLDFEDKGKILDDEINETIVRPLVQGVKLHAIIDTCHSGTILDLPYLCRMSRTGYWQWENHTRRPDKCKGTKGGLAISISGCNDDQKSADSSGFSDQSASIGAMTDSFIKAVGSEPGTTYGRLLSAMRSTIRDGQGSGRRLLTGRFGSFVRNMIASSSVQEPQLCSSEAFDIYRKPFLL
ncbi:metacaspase-1 [Brachypodium distachyon]|uniref:Peptidase C14 caspase domain-containing protein n=1 Tax=Brachypodium distachyon TaxID=15368 RepID=I1H4W5_BRADI|nr:metacaspase-1 [Brachypodium distachyon]KQK21440.1 hypothetical protein BRADI_1g60762v3 [Brachypodium distachyon]|eukprot:XP_003561579.1 metacaspase-1 [Brachypodium distachyon]